MTKKQFDRWKLLAMKFAENYPQRYLRKWKREVLPLRVGDLMDNFESKYRYIENWDEARWDHENTPGAIRVLCPSDSIRSYFYDYHSDEIEEETVGGDYKVNCIYNLTACCIRAALDMVVEPSAGVPGFATAGYLRKIFDNKIPRWFPQVWVYGLMDEEFKKIKLQDIGDNESLWM